MLRFDERVAVVTGAGGGLGREYALLLASRGCKVVVNDLGGGRDGSGKSSNAADNVVEEIKSKGGQAVANYNSVEDGDQIIKTAIDAFGRVDILINNAGILRDKAFVNMSEAEFDIIHKVHLKGSFLVTKAAWPHMRKQNYGKVIMTASAAGIFGNFGQANYSSAKLALLGLSNTLAIEGRKYNISVNTVVPTAASRLTEDIMPPEIFEKLKPQFVSPVTVWLCHEDCPETGGCFEAAGGFVAKYQFFRSLGKAYINDDLTLENLRSNWDQVTNLQGARILNNIQEQTISVVEALQSGVTRPALTPAQTPQSVVDDESVFRYNIDTAILYNLAVGVSTGQPDHLKFLYENAEEFSIVPSFGVIPAMNAVFTSKELHEAVNKINGDPARMLHGEQFLELYKPLEPSAALKTVARIVDVLDKGSGAVVIADADTFDINTGEKVAYTQWLVFFVGAGKFGGPRTSNKVIPTAEAPKRQPDAIAEDKTSIDQAALYRLCGDKNPLHIDPQFAAMGGWSQPIMHGLCSLGYSTRHVMKTFANNDMSAFKSLKVRFTGPVIPGETIRTRMWKEGNRILFDTVAVESGKTVIGGAVIELRTSSSSIHPAVPPSGQSAASGKMASNNELKTDLVFEGMGFRIEEQPELASKIQAIYEYNITKDGKTVATWTLDLKNGDGAVYKGSCKDGKPNCVVTISDDDMFSMAVGELDPQKAFMTGKLKVRGNIMLMQKLKLLLKPSPESKDSEAAAPLASGAELKCKRIFANTNEKISKTPDLAADIQTVFQFDILQGGKLTFQYTLDLKNGAGSGYEGPAKDKPDCILIMEDEVLDKVHSGKLDAQRAFMSQKLKVKGNVLASQKLADLWADERDREETEEAEKLPGVTSAGSNLTAPSGSPKTVKADFIFNVFLYHLRQDPAMVEHIAGLVKCMYHWVILQKGKKASEWTSDLKTAKGDLYNEAPRGGASPEVQITIDDEDLVQLMLGKLNPQKAFMQGRLKIRGNIMLMQKFNTLWQEILKSGRVVELKLMAPLLSDGQPLSADLWSDYQFFIVTQRLAHLPQLIEASQGTAYYFSITKDGTKRSEWTIDLTKGPGAVYRGAPKEAANVCQISIDDLAFHYLVEGAQTSQQAFGNAQVSNQKALDALAPLFLTKSKL